MHEAHDTPDITALLAHAGWARALARTLVADDATADDLVQDAWIAALRGGYRRDDAPRGWLAKVLRNLAMQRRRSEAQRMSRERVVSATKPIAEDEAVVERAQLEHELVALVLGLEPATRRAILLRFFDGLTAEQIATREGVPASTVRNRVARGLEKLRGRLDVEHGDRSAWMGAFAVTFGSGGATLVPHVPHATKAAGVAGGALVLTKLLVVAAIAVAAGTGWVAWRAATAPSDATTVADASSGNVELAKDELATARDATGRTDPLASPLALTAPNDGEAELLGRFVDADGHPIAGVACTVLSGARSEPYVVREASSVVIATSGVDGTFVARLVPSATSRYLVEASIAGRATFARGIEELAPDQHLDLGTITLAPPASIAATLADAQGVSAGVGWRLVAMRVVDGVRWRTASFERNVDALGADGAFHVGDLAAGEWSVVAEHAGGFRSKSERVTVAAGDTKAVALRIPTDVEHTIHVDVSARFLLPRELATSSITLTAPGFEPRHPTSPPQSISSYDFRDVPPGEYVVRVDDPLFEPWTSEPITPGKSIRAKVVPSARLVLDLRDGTGAPFTRPFSIDARRKLAHGSSSGLPFKAATDPVPSDGFRVLPSAYALTLHADGAADVTVDVPEIAPGETRVVHATISSGARIAGVVLDADGTTPVGGARVGLFAPAQVDDSSSSAFVAPAPGSTSTGDARCRLLITSTTSDVSGRFAFDALAPGVYVVRAEDGVGLVRALAPMTLELDAVRDDLRLVLPAHGSLAGTIALPDDVGADVLASTCVELRLVQPNRFLGRSDVERFVPIGRTRLVGGRYAFERVAPGDYELRVRPNVDAKPVWDGRGHTRSSTGVLLATVHVDAGPALERTDDLRTTFPGACRARITIGGGAREDWLVAATRAGDIADGETILARIDEHGDAAIGALAIGSWRCFVLDVEGGSTYAVPASLTIAPGRTTKFVLDVPVHAHHVTILDAATHQPMRDAKPCLVVGDERACGFVTFTTDGEGVASLELAPGRYRATATPNTWHERPEEGLFDWTASGPSPAVLELTRP